MIRPDFIKRVIEMLDNPDFRLELLERCTALYDSGGVDTLDYDDDYQLPKMALTVAFEELANSMSPLFPEGKAELKNLRKF